MRTRMLSLTLLFIVSLGTAACTPGDSTEGNAANEPVLAYSGLNPAFGDYWYKGKAEITTYSLEQVRYGAVYNGSAVTIFVTEDLSRRKQVKLDNPDNSPGDAVKVLKLNAERKFDTGIYPYSVLTSVFTPVYRDRDPSTLKVTASIQEWCGQTFAQMNRVDGGYRIRHFSYFEDEGDGDDIINFVLLEDELWNIVRMNPSDLPSGSIDILPSAVYHRLSHDEWKIRRADARVLPVGGDASLMEFRLSYEDIDRALTIRFRSDFPHEIEYWEETGGPSSDGVLTTRASLEARTMIDYWNHNSPADSVLRAQLGL